ncbi:hypothetical protein C900_04314 [Fulvivirga imtechensis AK7]|uniref:Uncharacterized protein n=1 Tax=Fulvivirga imtechensis AK7 TaxID=1237149 RepID=L8K1X6_9BACT|nr:hypothetical protein C900_04314 [Fulvivirga imtechensis AK7]
MKTSGLKTEQKTVNSRSRSFLSHAVRLLSKLDWQFAGYTK